MVVDICSCGEAVMNHRTVTACEAAQIVTVLRLAHQALAELNGHAGYTGAVESFRAALEGLEWFNGTERSTTETETLDFARDHEPCELCDQGYGHLNRAGQMIWDLHEVPAIGGRVFQECTAPHAAMLRVSYRAHTDGTAR